MLAYKAGWGELGTRGSPSIVCLTSLQENCQITLQIDCSQAIYISSVSAELPHWREKETFFLAKEEIPRDQNWQ